LQTGLPLDDRLVVADITARDALAALVRYEGMLVYVEADATNYQLVGGITNSDWIELSGSGGGTGGGITVDLEGNDGDPAPELVLENSFRVFKIVDGSGQKLRGDFDVPEGYEVGSQIFLRLKLFTTDTSGNVDMQTDSYLYTPTSELDTLPFSHSSTNAAQNVPGTARRFFTVDLDLTDASGEIDGQPVAVGDAIRFDLFKNAGTSTADIRLMQKQTRIIIVEP
jgi:hypothetical protein